MTSGRAIARGNVSTRGRVHNDGTYAARHSINRGAIAKRDDKPGRTHHANRDWDHSWEPQRLAASSSPLLQTYVYTPWLYSNADCGWLYQRAIATGSAYWWSRYDACANY